MLADGPPDPWITAAAQFLHQWGPRGRRTRQKIADFSGELRWIAWARAIWGKNDIRRWAVEAGVLARQSAEAIGAKLGLPARTIEAYEALFFDLRGRLDCHFFISTCVINIRALRSAGDVGRIWRHFGYHAGITALDMLIDDFESSGQPSYEYLLSGVPVPSCLGEEQLAMQLAITELLLPKADFQVNKVLMLEAARRRADERRGLEPLDGWEIDVPGRLQEKATVVAKSLIVASSDKKTA